MYVRVLYRIRDPYSVYTMELLLVSGCSDSVISYSYCTCIIFSHTCCMKHSHVCVCVVCCVCACGQCEVLSLCWLLVNSENSTHSKAGVIFCVCVPFTEPCDI